MELTGWLVLAIALRLMFFGLTRPGEYCRLHVRDCFISRGTGSAHGDRVFLLGTEQQRIIVSMHGNNSSSCGILTPFLGFAGFAKLWGPTTYCLQAVLVDYFSVFKFCSTTAESFF